MTSMPSAPRKQALRRYPALAFLALAAILAVALPSALNLPNAGPPTLAEFAPVPGLGQSTGGDLGRLGSGSSGETGVGGGAGGIGAPPLDPQQPGGSRFRCVGTPPRQTEDPLSPPCVAFFEGDNFGATARGVTADEITVVIWWRACPAGPACTNFVDYGLDPKPDEPVTDQIGKVYSRYFNARYQLYGRRAHFWGYYQSANGDTPQRYLNDIIEIDDRLHPFALVPASASLGTASIGKEAARRGIVVTPYESFERDFYRSVAPRLFSYSPDIEDTARFAADYVCTRLVGRRARFSGNELDRAEPRKFGVLYTDSAEEQTSGPLARLFIKELRQRCSEPVEAVLVQGTQQETYDDYPIALTQMRNAGVTTVVPITKAGDPLIFLNASDRLAWYPEWFFPRAGRFPDDTTSHQLWPPQVWRHAFGLSFDYRRGRVQNQLWYLAYKEACPDCDVPIGYWPSRAYETLSLLFYGIQSAGPNLTDATLDRGLHAIPERASTGPAVPATYFRPGNYSWVKDVKEMWWDPTGSPPGQTGAGCYRLPRGGKRFRIGEWPRGDRGLFGSGQPCQGVAQL